MSDLIVTMTFSLPADEKDALYALADRREISVTHALRQAIASELFIQARVDEGDKFLIQPREGEIQQLVWTQTEVA